MGAPFTLPNGAEATRADMDVMLAGAANALHMKRALFSAFDYGLTLLDALDLEPLALDRMDAAIAALDAMDEDPEAEDDGTAEAEPDDEDGADAEHSLGAPERSPYTASMGESYYKPARGGRLLRCFATRAHNQAQWAAGANVDGEGEPEAGYDLPEGDDEKCGSEHDGCEPEEKEDDLGSAAGNGDQRHWAQGGGGSFELVNEDGEDGNGRVTLATRPISPRRPDSMGHHMRDDAKAIARRARDVRARLHPSGAPAEDPDTVTILRDGVAFWSGPYVTRDGIPVIGCAT